MGTWSRLRKNEVRNVDNGYAFFVGSIGGLQKFSNRYGSEVVHASWSVGCFLWSANVSVSFKQQIQVFRMCSLLPSTSYSLFCSSNLSLLTFVYLVQRIWFGQVLLLVKFSTSLNSLGAKEQLDCGWWWYCSYAKREMQKLLICSFFLLHFTHVGQRFKHGKAYNHPIWKVNTSVGEAIRVKSAK